MNLLDKSRQQYYRHAREHSFLEIRFQRKSHILTKTTPLVVWFHSAAREKGVLKTIATAVDPCHISEYCCMNPSISDFSDTDLHNLLTKQTAECEWRVEIRSKGIAMAIPTDLCISPVLPYWAYSLLEVAGFWVTDNRCLQPINLKRGSSWLHHVTCIGVRLLSATRACPWINLTRLWKQRLTKYPRWPAVQLV